ncbi:MAG TPA: hypothetical protein VM532_12165, partial [Burkholderiales bacterium]|nr:hypothetical protein [Burkholderiales bacterium]
NAFIGGAGADALTGGSGNEIFFGGAGNDAIVTGDGHDVIAFNRGDGDDTVAASAGADNTLSLGGGIAYEDLAFEKSGDDLILDAGAGESVTLTGWYASAANHSVLNLQVMAEAMAAFDATSSDPLLNNKVEQFNFGGLVDRFDAVRAADPGVNRWALMDALLDFHLGGGDSGALGGDLAHEYGKHGNLGNVGSTGAQNVLGNSQFGVTQQTFQTPAGLQEGLVKLG